jgi:predicted phosphodiesterase
MRPGALRARLAPLLLAALAAACEGSSTTPAHEDAGACVGTWSAAAWADAADTTFLRGPYLQSVMADQAVVVVRDAPGGPDACVSWSLPGAVEQSVCGPADANGQYELTITGLPPDTPVTYRVTVGPGRETIPLSFRSAPDDGRPVRLLVFADAHANADTLGVIAAGALADGVDAAVAVGDSVSQPEEAQFDTFFGALRPLLHRVPLWPVIGNHENLGEAYFDAVVVPGAGEAPHAELYYAVRIGDVWLAALDLLDLQLTAAFGTDLPEATWLRAALQSPEARGARWRLLLIHEPPYCAGWGSCDAAYHGEAALRDFLLPLAAAGDVAAIVSGHMHGYEHGVVDGVHLFVTGGAGGGLDQGCPTPDGFPSPWEAAYVHHRLLVDAACDALTVEARGLDGALIETTRIER